jgi:type IV pilus biogenesis protein CpaD/CtpE
MKTPMNTRILFLSTLIASAAGCAAPPDPAFRHATGGNLETMLANPRDAGHPARSASRLAVRRDTVFQHYVKGEDTAAHRSKSETAAVSDVAKAGN